MFHVPKGSLMNRLARLLLATTLMLASTLASAANPLVELKTNQGSIVLELDAAKAPISVDNFLQYVKNGFYNGTIFHRVIDGFMVQGGGMDKEMNEKSTRAPIKNEGKNGLKNVTGSIAMARMRDPNSASAQFFINLVDNGPLDYPSPDGYGYAVFGKVIKGMDVVQAIAKVQTGNVGFHQNVPTTPVIIESAKLLPEKK